jgi:sugar phosphate isomerase/epimerase
MMKLAIYAGSVADGTLQGSIQYCKDLELERLVVPLDPIKYGSLIPGYAQKGYLGLEDLKPIKQEIEDAGLSFSVMQLWPFMAVGAPETEARLDSLGRTMATMGQCGVGILSYFAGIDRSVTQTGPEARWGLMQDHYRKLMAHAEGSGVKIALHTGGDLWTSQGLARLVREFPSPCNGVCLCTGNSWRFEGEGIYDMIRRLGDRILHVHLRGVKIVPGDPREQWVWFGSGEPDLTKVVKALRDIDYRGELHAEHLPGVVGERDEEIRTAFAVGYMRAVMQFA